MADYGQSSDDMRHVSRILHEYIADQRKRFASSRRASEQAPLRGLTQIRHDREQRPLDDDPLKNAG